MPRRIPAILAAVLLAAPVMAQETETTPVDPALILPAPGAEDAADTMPDTIPASGSRCSQSKAVTS